MRILLILCFFISTGAFAKTEIIHLSPLQQSYSFESISTPITGNFTVAGTDFQVTAKGLEVFSFTITLPDGTIVDANNAELQDFQLSTTEPGEIPLFNPNLRSVTYSSSQVIAGSYQFTIIPEPENSLVHVSVTELSGLSGELIIGPPNTTIEANEAFSVTAVLQREGILLDQANTILTVTDQDKNIVYSGQLLDDGVSPDTDENDGVYNRAITLENDGQYQLKVDVIWIDQLTGSTYQGSLFKHLSIKSPQIFLSGEFTERIIDEDNDNLIDALELTFAESAPRVSREYSLTVILENSSGTASISATRRTANNSLPLAVKVPYDRIKLLEEDGPYFVKALNIWSGPEIIGHWKDFGYTQAYKLEDMERRNTLITGLTGDMGIDNDGDGLFEQFKVDMIIDVVLPGYYTASADLKSADKDSLAESNFVTTYLSKGKNTVSLYFLGSDIGISGIDGPYLIGNAFVYPEFKARASIHVKILGETGVYQCSQFAGCDTDMVSEIKRIANSLCTLHSHKLLAKLKMVDSLAIKHPDVAENQLSGLFSKAKALERSGSCPPASGWISDRQEQGL